MGQVTYRLLFLRESGPLATTRHTLLLYSAIERVDKFERYTCALRLRRKERGQILTRSRSVYFCIAVGQRTVHYTGSSQFVWLLESGIAQIESKYHFSGIEIRFMKAYLLTESVTRNVHLLCSKRDYFSRALIILLRQISFCMTMK